MVLDGIDGSGRSSPWPRAGGLAGLRSGRTGARSLISEGVRGRNGLMGCEFDLGLLGVEGGFDRFNMMMRRREDYMTWNSADGPS